MVDPSKKGAIFPLSSSTKDDQENDENNSNETPADFETAIKATKFGKFNIIIILLAIPAGWSSMFETTSMSYVFPVAQCDLELTPQMKGALNAMCYAGMISSAFIWGFLCDTLGRRKLSIIGFLLDAIFVIISSLSQNVTTLMIAKYFGGFIIGGPFAAVTTYISEFHCAKYRARLQMVFGMSLSSANIFLPLLAWLIMPLDLNFEILDGYMKFHAWNLFLLICALPALCSFIGFLFMPESPKFLMTQGRNQEALHVFQKVYAFNTGKSPDTFPIKTLVEEKSINSVDRELEATTTRTTSKALKDGWEQTKPLFFPPHLSKIILVCFMQMFFMMGSNTIRLWMPQILQAINDYQYYNNGSTASLCTMIELIKPNKLENITEECVVNLNNSFVYINSIIIAVVAIGGYVIVGMTINYLGKKRLLVAMGAMAGGCAIGLYFSQNNPTVITLSSFFIALASICVNVTLAVVVDLFPTTLRTMTVSLAMMCGRIGAMSGNLLFPALLQIGCAAPFFTVAAAIIGKTLLITKKRAKFCSLIKSLGSSLLSLILPNTDMKPLQ